MITEHRGPYKPGDFIYIVHRIVDEELRKKFYLRLAVAQLITDDTTMDL
jgi:hypothetical protein